MYDELMSLKLDGLLAEPEARRLDEHISVCEECAGLWAVMKEADALLWASALEPAPVPANLHARVMERIAAVAPVGVATPVPPVPQPQPLPARPAPATSVLGPRSADTSVLPLPVDPLQELQGRLAVYMRGIVLAGLSVLGGVLLLLALVMSNAVELGGPLATPVAVLRTLFEAAGTWLRSMFFGLGPEMITAAGLVLGLLALIGWQVIAAYHRAVGEQPDTTGYAEAAV
jgi:anti-sigma factor RsiW